MIIAWIGIPVASAFFFVVGGILLGYLFTYSDRSGDKNAILEAESKYAKARSSAVNRKRAFLDLEKQVETHAQMAERLTAENASLKKQQHTWETQSQEVQGHLQRLERARKDAVEAHGQTDASRRSAETMLAESQEAFRQEQQSHRATQQQAQQEFNKIVESQAIAEQRLSELNASMQAATSRAKDAEALAQKFEEKNHELAAQIKQSDQRADQLVSQAQDLDGQLATQASEVEGQAKRIEELLALTGDRDALARTHAELQHDYDAIQSKLEAELDAHAESRERIEDLATRFKESELRLGESDEQVQQHNRMLIELRQTVEDRTQRNVELESQQNSLRAQASEAERLLIERDGLIAELQDIRSQLETQQAEQIVTQQQVVELTQLNSGLQAQLETTAAQRDQTNQKLVAVNESVDELRDVLAQRETELQRKSLELAEGIQIRDAKIEELAGTTETQAGKIQNQHEQLDQLRVVDLERVEELGNVKRILGERTESLQTRSSDLATAVARSQQQDKQLQSIQANFSEQKTVVEQLQTQLKTLEQFRPKAEELTVTCEDLSKQLAEARQHLQIVSDEHEASLGANAKMEDRVVLLESELHEHTKTIRDLRRTRASLRVVGDSGDSVGDDVRRAA